MNNDNDWSIWREAVEDASLRYEIAQVYRDLSTEILKHQKETGGPVCQASGRCCDFEKWGHRLYVTGLEIACFYKELSLQAVAAANSVTLPQLGETSGRKVQKPNEPCVYQVNGLCSVHEIRPLGCRIFFCDEASDDWQQAMYELFFGRIKTLHESHEIPYAYMEWRAGVISCFAALSDFL